MTPTLRTSRAAGSAADAAPVTPRLARYGRLVSASPAMHQLFQSLQRLESSELPVLIRGESGAGKELVARAIHDHSPLKRGPFVALNCGALDRGLARSELFGHRRGAFTGASETQQGVFEAAHGGTLFLDEIGELPLAVQPLLLRALETRTISRVGESEVRAVKVRVLTATHRDLGQRIRSREFREDLFYRLAAVQLEVPALRARPEDIRLLAQHFAREAGADAVSPHVIARFQAHSWPGNVRELRNAVQSYAILGEQGLRLSTRADADCPRAALYWIDPTEPYAAQKERALREFASAYLERLMQLTGGNQSQAARISGLDRSYLGQLLARRKTGSEPI